MESATDFRLTQVRYVILFVRDMERAVGFYRDALGLEVLDRSPTWVELDAGGFTLALHLHEDRARWLGEGSPQVVFQVEDLDEACWALEQKGVRIEHPPKTVFENQAMVGLAVSFEDPDGNVLSVYAVRKMMPRPL